MLWRTNDDRPILFTLQIFTLFQLFQIFFIQEKSEKFTLFTKKKKKLSTKILIFLCAILTDKNDQNPCTQWIVIAILSAHTASLDWSNQISNNYHPDSTTLYTIFPIFIPLALSFTFTHSAIHTAHSFPRYLYAVSFSPFSFDFSLRVPSFVSLRFRIMYIVLIAEGKCFSFAPLF